MFWGQVECYSRDCQGCWFFYYNGDWDPDCNVNINRGDMNNYNSNSTESPNPNSNFNSSTVAGGNETKLVLPPYLCLMIDEEDQAITTSGDDDPYSGAFIQSTELIDDKYHYWSQILNKEEPNELNVYYFVYDAVFGFWSLATGTHGMRDGIANCNEYFNLNQQSGLQSSSDNPANCKKWRTFSSKRIVKVTISEQECNNSEGSSKSSNSTGRLQLSSMGMFIGLIVIGVCIVCCVLVVILIILCDKRKRKNKGYSQQNINP